MSLAIRYGAGCFWPSNPTSFDLHLGLPSMDHTSPARSREASTEPRSSGGLRLRIWIACLAGALVSGAGIWWVVGTQLSAGPSLDLAVVVSWLGAVAGLGVM